MNIVELEGLQDVWDETPESDAIEQRDKYLETHWDEIMQHWDDTERTDDYLYQEPSYICWRGCWMGDSIQWLAY